MYPILSVGDTQMGRVWGTTASIILQSFCSIKCQEARPSSELKKYTENARRNKTDILEKRKRAIAQLNWL